MLARWNAPRRCSRTWAPLMIRPVPSPNSDDACSRFRSHPRYARMLLAAHDYGCVRPVALIAALTQGRDLLVRRQGKQVDDARDDLIGGETESDFFVLMRAWHYAERNGYEIERCRRMGIHAQARAPGRAAVRAVLADRRRRGFGHQRKAWSRTMPCSVACWSGFPTISRNVWTRGSLRCELVHGRRGILARESVVKAPLFVAAEVREVESGGGRERNLNVVLNLATAVKEEWLRELFPEDFKEDASRCLRPGVAPRRCPGGETLPRSASGRENFRQSAGR